MTHYISLRKEGEAIFDMSLANSQHRGLFVSLITMQSAERAHIQFDDFGETKRWQSVSTAIGNIIEGDSRGEDVTLSRLREGEVVWRPDDHYATSRQERGFLAFQKIVQKGVTELLCMVMKKDAGEDPEDTTLRMHSVIFSPNESDDESRVYPVISTSGVEWKCLCYITDAMRRASSHSMKISQKPIPPLSQALQIPEKYFSTNILLENITRIKSVFGI